MSTQMYTRTYDPASDKKYSDLHKQQSTVDVEEHYDLCQDGYYVEINDLECSVGVNYSKSEGKKPERSQSKQPPLYIKKGQEKQEGDNSVKTRRHLKNDRNVDQSHGHDFGKWMKPLIFVTVISVIVIASAVTFTLVFETKSETQSTAETPCSSSPCLHNGTCVIQNGTYICQCPTGFEGDICGVTPCSANPCLNDGACSVSGNSFKCSCRSGYYGSRCEKTPCSSNPCSNKGRCSVSGKTPCSSNPCLNNGACSVSGSSYKCSCRSGYYGSRCEKTPCSSNPCLNNGACIVSGSSYKCSCRPGFYGSRCEKTPCSSNPCFNNGACSVSESSYKCSCRPGFYGSRCETKVCESGWSQLDDECYFYSDVKRSWDSAQSYCKYEKGGILAEINAGKDIDFLRTGCSGTHTYWLGARGIDDHEYHAFRWASSGSTIIYSDKHTRTGYKRNNANEYCMSISENEWGDDKCWKQFRFICQKRLE